MLFNGDDVFLKSTRYLCVCSVKNSEICRKSTIFMCKKFRNDRMKRSEFKPSLNLSDVIITFLKFDFKIECPQASRFIKNFLCYDFLERNIAVL